MTNEQILTTHLELFSRQLRCQVGSAEYHRMGAKLAASWAAQMKRVGMHKSAARQLAMCHEHAEMYRARKQEEELE